MSIYARITFYLLAKRSGKLKGTSEDSLVTAVATSSNKRNTNRELPSHLALSVDELRSAHLVMTE